MRIWSLQQTLEPAVWCNNPLMKIIAQLHQSGVPLEELQFRPANKVFHFGGDASSVASWSIHLPVTINGKNGLIQTFIVDGNTPFLIGRPILQFFAVMINYQTDAISLQDGAWQPAKRGPRGEYLLQLSDPGATWTSTDVHFDLMTNETVEQIDERVSDDVVTLHSSTLNQHSDQVHLRSPSMWRNLMTLSRTLDKKINMT